MTTLSRRSFLSASMFALGAAGFALAGCNNAGSSAAAAKGKDAEYKICFVEIVENDAFVSMMKGFKDQMSNLGYNNVTYDVKNAQGDSATLNQIAAGLKTEDFDVIVPIATPGAQACANAELETPMVFISVTDPIAAGLTSDLDRPDKNITGTSNFSPVDEIYQAGLTLMPQIADKPLGLLYCTGEKNAVVTAEKMKAYLDDKNIKYTERTIANSSEAQAAAATLATEAGAIYVPMDSVVQAAMAQVTQTATEAKIPVLGSDPVMVKSGALLSVACGNETIGRYSADLADKILNGTKVEDIPVDVVNDNTTSVSKKTAEALGITIPTDNTYEIL